MVFLFDTSAINRLYDDPAGEAIVTGLTATNVVRVSALNVLEAGRTAHADRRCALLRLLKRMTGGARPLEMPNVLARRAMTAYGQRSPVLDASIDADADILWHVLQDPTDLDDEVRRHFDELHRSIEGEFRQCHERARPHFQALFKGDVVAPRRASALLRAYMERQAFAHEVINDLYRGCVGADLAIGELPELFRIVPEVAGYLLAWGHSVHQRSIASDNYGMHNAGMVDMWFATYLGRTHRFITADDRQYRALRLIAKIVAPACTVSRYHGFRQNLVGRS
jgi:hypothetical protein